ncbi:hypothetical protein HOY80DRAFT_970531 [Tuber brumale]|nr:hypothetical protein HOY80DRAFT_970531 [Tuber brumale]
MRCHNVILSHESTMASHKVMLSSQALWRSAQGCKRASSQGLWRLATTLARVVPSWERFVQPHSPPIVVKISLYLSGSPALVWYNVLSQFSTSLILVFYRLHPQHFYFPRLRGRPKQLVVLTEAWFMGLGSIVSGFHWALGTVESGLNSTFSGRGLVWCDSSFGPTCVALRTSRSKGCGLGKIATGTSTISQIMGHQIDHGLIMGLPNQVMDQKVMR